MILISAISRPVLFSEDDMRKVLFQYFFAILRMIGACFSPDADTTTISVILGILFSFPSTSDSVAKNAPR
jgi:hypothetical protein